MSDESMSGGTHALLDVDVSLSILGAAREEISALEHELASVEADCRRVHASLAIGVGSSAARAAATVQRFIEERLVEEREAMRVQLDDARRVAIERVRRAEHEAAESVRLARAQAFDRLIEGPVGPARARPVLPTGAPHPLDAAGAPLERAARAGACSADFPGGAAVAASAAVQEGTAAPDDDGFRGFWREADEAAHARSLALVPFSAVLPALAALLLIVFSLLFMI